MIQIYVGEDGGPPLSVPESTLCNASVYFVKAIENERLGGGESGVLKFPADDVKTWQVLLFWIVRSEISDDVRGMGKEAKTEEKVVDVLLLVQAWLLGEIYSMPQFQDLIMLELLRVSEDAIWKVDVIQMVFESTAPEMPLRRLASEEALFVLCHGDESNKMDHCDLDNLDAVGVTGSMLAAVRRASEIPSEKTFATSINRLKSERWSDYMVKDGPPDEHWVYKEDSGSSDS